MFRKLIIYAIFLFVLVDLSFAVTRPKLRTSDPSLYTIGYMTGNRVGISFYNDGAVSGFNTGVDIRGEWPLGSGYNYIGDLTPLIGVEALTKTGSTFHSVGISRGPRNGQLSERDPSTGAFWGFNPVPGFRNPQFQSVALSDESKSWPTEGWGDRPDWKDSKGVTQWNGYFGRGVINADLEAYYVADDNGDREFNKKYGFFPDKTDSTRKGMGLQMYVRSFQWANVLAQDVIFWLYKIRNDATTIFNKAAFGTVVGTLAGGDGDSADDLGYFDPSDWITYSWDADGKGNKGQSVGYVGYAYLESPGNPYDGIDNDDDCVNPNLPRFTKADFDSTKKYKVGDKVVLIDSLTFERKLDVVKAGKNIFYSMGRKFVVIPDTTFRREGYIIGYIIPGVDGLQKNPSKGAIAVTDASANDGIDNDLDGLIDENESTHYSARINYQTPGGVSAPKLPLRYIDYVKLLTTNDYTSYWDPMVDEKREGKATKMITSYVKDIKGVVTIKSHWDADEDGDWNPVTDDVGTDGIGPYDDGYTGPDADGTEGNGKPDDGEPNFNATDPHESDQIGLTGFNFFAQASSPDMSQDEELWNRMTPGRFDVVPPTPQDGDFIYSSGYFPLVPGQEETFSVAILFGNDYASVIRQKKNMQEIYNYGYTFAKPPRAPRVNITQENGKVILYWDPELSTSSIDVMTKEKDFEGFKIYRATDNDFRDARTITNAFGELKDDLPLAQYDLVDHYGTPDTMFFQATPDMLTTLGGYSFNLGKNTGIVNKYVDSTATPGLTWYYAVCAYDRGDASKKIFPSINPKTIMVTSSGEIVCKGGNTAYIRPGRNVAGFKRSDYTISKSQKFAGTGSVYVNVVDNKKVRNGVTYKMIFSDTSVQHGTRDWTLIAPSTTSGVKYDTLFKNSTQFNEPTKVFDGLNISVLPDNIITFDTAKGKTGFVGVANPPKYIIKPLEDATVQYRGKALPNDYQIEFNADPNYGTSIPDTVSDGDLPATNTNFKVKNLTTGEDVDYAFLSLEGATSQTYFLWFKEKVGGKIQRSWRIDWVYPDKGTPLPTSGVFKITTKKPFFKTDTVYFTTQGATVDNDAAKSEMNKIKVVPNPYVVTHIGEPKLSSFATAGRGERNIRFTHVPYKSKINIYTVRGELIRSLYQDDLYNGDVKWDLRTSENLDVAFGVYIYVVDAPGVGTKTGKLALIK